MDSVSGSSDNESEKSEDSQIYERQNARRQQMLKDLNLAHGGNKFAQNQNQSIFQHFKNKKQNIKEQIKQNIQNQEQNQMKRLRMKDALLFFQRMKFQVLIGVLNAIRFISRHSKAAHQNLPFVISLLDRKHIKRYTEFKEKQISSISIQDYLIFLQSSINHIQLKKEKFTNHQILWSLSQSLGLIFRKINFHNISSLQLEANYNLKYKQQKVKFNKKNVMNQFVKKKMNLIQQQLLNSGSFQDLQTYTFNSKNSETNVNKMRLDKRKSLIKSSQSSFYEFFCFVEKKWIIFNVQTVQTHTLEELKEFYLDGKAIIGFFSVRLIQVKKEYLDLMKKRKLATIQIKDLIYYADKIQNLKNRRRRSGCQEIYRQIMKMGNFRQPQIIMTNIEKTLIQIQLQKEQNYYLQNFPLTWKNMKISEHFVIKSQIPRYMVLKENAQDIGRMFKQQKVYHRSDLVRTSSKMGWVDCSRMVIQGSVPIKIVQNKKGNETKLYLYKQTQPFRLKIDQQTGNVITDQQYNSVYVPPNFIYPENMVIIKENIEYICKRYKFKHCRLVQGFTRANSRIVPNNIGFLVNKEDEEAIRELYNERMKKLHENKSAKEDQQIVTMWKKLFKNILLNQQISQIYKQKL